jgi:branched-chain amino acid transport system permease protein
MASGVIACGHARAVPAGRILSVTAVRAAWLAVLVLAVALPFLLGGFRVYQLTLAASYAMAILGLNLLTGYSGQISLGHGAFFALGGYVTAGLMARGVDAYLTLPAAGLACFAVGLAIGRPAARLPFLALALATYALAVATPQFLKSSLMTPWTGGVQGLYVDRPDVPFGLPLSTDQWWYFVALAVLVAALWSANNLAGGRIGRTLLALKDDPVGAAACGVDVPHLRALAFGAAAFYAGLGGAFAVLVTDFIAPDRYGFFFSIQLLVGAVIGGVQSIAGAVIGGLVIQFLPDLADRISKNLTWPVYGMLLIAAVWLAPNGVVGLLGRERMR